MWRQKVRKQRELAMLYKILKISTGVSLISDFERVGCSQFRSFFLAMCFCRAEAFFCFVFCFLFKDFKLRNSGVIPWTSIFLCTSLISSILLVTSSLFGGCGFALYRTVGIASVSDLKMAVWRDWIFRPRFWFFPPLQVVRVVVIFLLYFVQSAFLYSLCNVDSICMGLVDIVIRIGIWSLTVGGSRLIL